MPDGFWGKQCYSCEEIMHSDEKICYCGGPVVMKKFPMDKKTQASQYLHRKFMAMLRAKEEK